jgi:hypothetical protein
MLPLKAFRMCAVREVKTYSVQDDTYAAMPRMPELDLRQVQRAWVVSDGDQYSGCERKRSPAPVPAGINRSVMRSI